jgi:hypothetical protein
MSRLTDLSTPLPMPASRAVQSALARTYALSLEKRDGPCSKGALAFHALADELGAPRNAPDIVGHLVFKEKTRVALDQSDQFINALRDVATNNRRYVGDHESACMIDEIADLLQSGQISEARARTLLRDSQLWTDGEDE